MKKTNKFLILLLSLSLTTMGAITLTSCNFNNNDDSSQSSVPTESSDTGSNDSTPKEETLGAPTLTLAADNSVSWAAVEGADGYIVNLNGTDLAKQSNTEFAALTDVGEYVIKVKAVKGETESEYSASVSYAIYGVTFPTQAGVTVTGESSVKSGENYSFSVTVDTENYTADSLVVKVNDVIVEAVEGVYTVENVSANVVIMVEGVAAIEYAVTLPTGEGYTVTGDVSVKKGEDYSFTVAVEDELNEVIVKVNDVEVSPIDGEYIVENVTEDLTITVELVSHRKYSITLNGEGFTVEGKLTDIEKGEDVTLTFTLNEGKDMIRLNEYTLLDNLTYTIEDIQEDIEYDVYTTDYVNALYWIQSWNDEGAYQEYAESKFDITSAAPKIDANYVKGLVNAGYTHLTFDVEMTANNGATSLLYMNGGTWNRYWRDQNLTANKTIRIDLNEFHDEDTFYSINLEPRCNGAGVNETLTITNVRAIKSAETLNWTKQNSNTYVAMEDGYIVMETHGNDGWVNTSADWFAPYLTKDDASQRTLSIYSEYIYKGDNTRTLVHGLNQQPINVVGNEGWSYFNNYTSAKEGDTLHLQLDRSGVVKVKLSPFVSNRNSWGTYKSTVISDTEVKFTADSEFKFRYALTQAYIDAGYTSVEVTFTGNFNGGEIWFGNDVWSGDTSYLQCKNAEGTYTVDLTKLAGEDLTFMLNGASVTDMTITLNFKK